MRPTLEVADIVRAHGAEFRQLRMLALCPQGRSGCCVPSNCVAQQPSVVIWNDATSAAMNETRTTRALWGVFSNGEFGPGIDAGLAFSTGLGWRRLTINSGGFCYVGAAIHGYCSTRRAHVRNVLLRAQDAATVARWNQWTTHRRVRR